jgi:hypothetical protein
LGNLPPGVKSTLTSNSIISQHSQTYSDMIVTELGRLQDSLKAIDKKIKTL